MLHPTKNTNFNPLNVRKGAENICTFICEECNTEFKKALNQVSSGGWCPTCVYKTEKKMKLWLTEKYGPVENQKKFEWCKKGKHHLKFDFYIEHAKLIIELDGFQHFSQVLDWRSVNVNQEYDTYKMKCLLKEGLSIIRIFQEDVLNDKNDWESNLTNAISDKININKRITCIKSNSKAKVNETYIKYEEQMFEFMRHISENPDTPIFFVEIDEEELPQSDEYENII